MENVFFFVLHKPLLPVTSLHCISLHFIAFTLVFNHQSVLNDFQVNLRLCFYVVKSKKRKKKVGLWLHVVLRDSPNRIGAKNSTWKVFLSTKVIVCSGKANMQNRELQHKVLSCKSICHRHVQEQHAGPLFYRDIFLQECSMS